MCKDTPRGNLRLYTNYVPLNKGLPNLCSNLSEENKVREMPFVPDSFTIGGTCVCRGKDTQSFRRGGRLKMIYK